MIPHPVCYINWEGRILFKNAEFETTFLKEGQSIGSFIELLDAKERPNVLTALRTPQQMDFKGLKMATAAGLNVSYDWRLQRSGDCALLMLFGR